jgi:hypothetical protein
MNQELTIEDIYKQKYLKYKRKYIELKQIGANNQDFYNHQYQKINYFLTSKKIIKDLKKLAKSSNIQKFFEKLIADKAMTITEEDEVIEIKKNLKNIKEIGTDVDDENNNVEKLVEETEEKAEELFKQWLEENKKSKKNHMVIYGLTPGNIIKLKIKALRKK